VLLHVATLLVVAAAFWKDIFRYWQEKRVVLLYVVAASVPTALIGLTFKDKLEQVREQYPIAICVSLLVTALLLLIMEKVKPQEREIGELGFFKALVLGTVQGMAIMPGISRSGSTIATGTFCGLKREDAVKFSFIMMVPAVGGAALLSAKDVVKNPAVLDSMPAGPCAAGFLVAAISGYVALKALIKLVNNHKMIYFSAYCAIVGLAGIVYFGLINKG
jgi:undecaprenyl-diphosphatase